MNPQNTVPDLPLRDIHLPDPVGWFPPAPGWWILLLLSVAIIAYGIWRIVKHRQRLSIYRSAIHELEQIKNNYQRDCDAKALSQALSILLRRVAITVTSRGVSAGLTGEPWLDHLDTLSREPCFNTDTGRLLIEAPYKPSADINGDALLQLCETWVKKACKPKNKAGMNFRSDRGGVQRGNGVYTTVHEYSDLDSNKEMGEKTAGEARHHA